MTPLEYYREQCRLGLFQEDEQQIQALEQLQKVRVHLIQEQRKRSGLLSALRKPKFVKGLYLWGGVGIGKTCVMDCFFHSLPFTQKLRMHFHHFMNLVQTELKKYQGQKNPLDRIVQDLAQRTLVLCFDEFIVSDIADAMILERLLNSFFAQGLCLVTTSNIHPDDLYKWGLQRQHFMPAIHLLKKKLEIMHLPGQIDYRLRHLKQAGIFYVPNDDIAEDNMEKDFAVLAGDEAVHAQPIQLLGRIIPIRKQAGNLIWFDFKVICGIPRSQDDYLALVKKYNTFFISDVPIIGPSARDKIILFIKLIDILYDARARLVLSAETTLDKIYNQGRLLAEYTRTLSRLMEMQSENYFIQ